MTAQLTAADLNRAHAELMKAAIPAQKCPECGRETFTLLPNDDPAPCMGCHGLSFAEWERDGVKFSGVVDKDGTPVFWGGAEEMRRLMKEDERRKAVGARLPIVRLVVDAVRFNWNPKTGQFERQ